MAEASWLPMPPPEAPPLPDGYNPADYYRVVPWGERLATGAGDLTRQYWPFIAGGLVLVAVVLLARR